MQPLLSAEQMRQVDHAAISETGLPETLLMEHAALGLVDALEKRFGKLLPETRGIILAGIGNNGGDALAAARILHQRGVQRLFVVLVGTVNKASPSTSLQLKILGNLGIAWGKSITPELLNACDWVLDGLLGTGLARAVEGSAKEAIELVNSVADRKWILSADLPSGLSAETGLPQGAAVRASETISFGFFKKGLVTGSAADYVGKLTLAPIQIPREIPFPVDTFLYGKEDAARLPYRKPSAHKGNFGHVFIWAGTEEKEGAAILAAIGAMRSGAGLVTLVGDRKNLESLRTRCPAEIMISPQGKEFFDGEPKGTLVIGPGLGMERDRWELLQWALKSDYPLVIDADGISLLASHAEDAKKLLKKRTAFTLLTPHPKEASRLLDTTVEKIERDRYQSITKLSTAYTSHILLKGKGTLLRAPHGPTIGVTAGNTALSKGGTGDLLSGIIASFLGQGIKPESSLPLAVYVHGRASEILAEQLGTERTSQATDIAFAIAEVFRELEKWKS